MTGHHEKQGRYGSYVLLCEYVYGNKVYETCSMGYGEDDRVLYERGMKDGEVIAYVNPEDPEDAILSAGIDQSGWIFGRGQPLRWDGRWCVKCVFSAGVSTMQSIRS